jgi:flagellin
MYTLRDKPLFNLKLIYGGNTTMMSQVINSAYRNYQKATTEVQKVMQNLAEGKPDLNITDTIRLTKMQNRSYILKVANKTVQQGKNLLNSAQTGVTSVRAVATKLKSIAQEAQSEEITQAERDMLVEEYNTLYEEIDFILDNTEYDGVRLLDGSFGTRNLTIDNDDSMEITLSNITEEGLQIGSYSRTIEAGDVLIGQANPNGGVYAEGDIISYGKTSIDSVQDAQDAVARLDNALSMLDEESSEIGAKSQRLEFTVSHLASMIGNLEMSIDTITDFDEAEHMSRLAQYQIRQQSAIAMMVQAQQLSQTIHQLLNQ